MPEIVADPPVASCSRLYSGEGIEESQQLAPDLSRPRARRARALREGQLGQSTRPAARYPQSEAPRP
jgi:hypothetical protein